MNYKDILSLIVLSGSAITALWKIIEGIGKLLRMVTLVENIAAENKILLKANFVILDGLKQMKCNGRVTQMYDEMRQFLINRGEKL